MLQSKLNHTKINDSWSHEQYIQYMHTCLSPDYQVSHFTLKKENATEAKVEDYWHTHTHLQMTTPDTINDQVSPSITRHHYMSESYMVTYG